MTMALRHLTGLIINSCLNPRILRLKALEPGNPGLKYWLCSFWLGGLRQVTQPL